MKQLILFCLLVVNILSVQVFGQDYKSIHQQQTEYYSQYGELSEKEYDKVFGTKTAPLSTKRKATCELEYDVYGWHPYWVGTAYNNYDFDLISTFSYFSYELDPATGNYNSIHSWKTSPSIDMAIAAGCRVELCVTNFGGTNNTTFLTNATARQTLIDSLIALVNYRNAHGVNIDFEGVPGSQRNNLTSFMIDLSNQLKAAIPGATVTMALFSVDWNNVFDIPALDPYVDKMIIMGYGYYYSGSSKAGPTGPLYSGTRWSSYNLMRSVNYYLDEGITPSKLVLGLPYYGYEYETVDNSLPSNTTGNFSSSRTYAYVRNNTSGNYSNKEFDDHSYTPYYMYQNAGNWRQAFVDDEYTLSRRYDAIKQKGIGGMGIWALGYDNGYTELWDALRDKLSTCAINNCSDSLFDMGGPHGNYYDNEDYTFTIAPDNAVNFTIEFTEFELEAGFDSLWIWDGPDTNAPLIGGYSGTSGPGTIVSSGNALTFRFYSDGATRKKGWKANYFCNLGNPPVTPLAYCVLNESATSARIKIDFDPLVDEYLVYQSSDGVNFTGPTAYPSNDFIVSGLTADQITYFKLQASNTDGTSGFTEVLAATPSSTMDNVIIVNGFDRASAGNTYDFIRQHGQSILNYGYMFSSATNEAVSLGIVQLGDYEIVDYILGEESTADETFSSTEQTLVKSYLDNGGKLFVSGAEIAWDLDFKGNANDKDFYYNYLKAKYVDDAPNGQSATYYELNGIAGDIFDGSGTINFDDGTNGTYDVNWPDVIDTTNGSTFCMEYLNVANQKAGVRFEGIFPNGTATGKLVNLGVPFETFYNITERNFVMDKVLDFFADPYVAPPIASANATYCDGDPIADVTVTPNEGGTLTWYDDAALTNSVGTGANFTPSGAIGITKYYVTETVGATESLPDSVLVTVFSLPTADAGTNQVICNGESVTLTASGGDTYQWDNGLGTGASKVISPTVTTAYQVTVTDGNACSNTDNVTVTVNSLPTINDGAITITNADCGLTNGSISGLFATGAGSLTYTWYDANDNQLAVSQNLTNQASGEYYVVATDDFCSATSSSYTINENGAPSVPVASGGGMYCEGDPIASLTVTGSGGTYTWYADAGLTNVITTGSSLNPGTITVTTTYYVTETNGGCESAADNETVVVNDVPVANAGNDVTICSGQTTLLNASGGTDYVWDNGLGNGSAHVVAPSSTTTYQVTVSDNGCFDVDAVIISVVNNPIANAGNDVTICEGETTTLSATGGSTYSWDNGLGTGDTKVVDPVSSTTYNVTVYDNGCQSTDDILVSVVRLPNANAGFDKTICSGQSTTVNATGGTSYNWDNGLGSGASHSVSPSGNTTYTVTVTKNGCSAIDAVSVIVKTSPAADAGVDQDICQGNSAFLQATGGVSFTWDNGLGTGSSHTVSPSGNTTYSVQVTGANGCSSNDQVTIYVHQLPTVNESNVTVTSSDCGLSNGSVIGIVGSGSGAIIYSWYDSDDNPVGTNSYISNMDAGSYQLVVTDNYCSDTSSVYVIEESNPAVPVVTGGGSYCSGESIDDLSATTGGGVITWYNDAGLTNQVGTGTIFVPGNVSITTTYYATETQGGCESSADSAQVIINQIPTVYAGADQEICNGESITLTATGATSYNWDNGLGTGAVKTVSPSATTSYIVIGSNGNCSSADQVNVTVYNDPVADFNTTETINYVPDYDVTFSNTSSNTTSYLWNFGDGNSSTQFAPTHTYTDTGVFTIELVALNGYCDNDTLILVDYVSIIDNSSSQLPIADFELVNGNTCLGESLTFTNNSINATSYSWQISGNGYQDNSSSVVPSFMVTTSGVYSISLTATNANGNDVQTQNVSITISNPSVASFEVSDSVAVTGAAITFTNTTQGGMSYWWDFDDGSFSSSNNQVLYHAYADTGNYHVSLIAENSGCGNDTAVVVVTIVDPSSVSPTAAFELSRLVVCEGDTIQIMDQSKNASSYSWSITAGQMSSYTVPDPIVTLTDEGVQTITMVVDNFGNKDTAMLNVTVNPLPIANFYASDTLIDINNNGVVGFNNYSSNAVSYYWDFGDGNTSTNATPWNMYQNTGLYSVMLVAINECAQDTLIKEDYIEIYKSTGIKRSFETIVEVYPNPFVEMLTISTTSSAIQSVHVENAIGQIVYSQNNATTNKCSLDLAEFESGIYVVEVELVSGESEKYQVVKVD